MLLEKVQELGPNWAWRPGQNLDLNCLHPHGSQSLLERGRWWGEGAGQPLYRHRRELLCSGRGLGLQTRQPCGAWLTHQVTPDHHWAHPCFSPGKTWGYGYQPGCAGQVGQGVNTQRLRGDIFHPGHREEWLGKRGRQREAEMEEAAGGESKRARERERWKEERERAKQEKTCPERGCPGSGPLPGPRSAPPSRQMLLGLQVTPVMACLSVCTLAWAGLTPAWGRGGHLLSLTPRGGTDLGGVRQSPGPAV